MASKLRVDEINGNNGNVSIGTATFTGGLSGDITGLNVTGVITATTLNQSVAGTGSSITVGDTIINSNSIGVGATTTAGRNAGVSTVTGTIIYNSDLGSIQVYNGNVWSNISQETGINATGGIIGEYESGGTVYRTHTFTNSGTLEVLSAPSSSTVDMLLVGGGGGSGRASGNANFGGAGAGGMIVSSGISISRSTNCRIVVGAGGVRTASFTGGGNYGDNGNDTSITIPIGPTVYTASGLSLIHI